MSQIDGQPTTSDRAVGVTGATEKPWVLLVEDEPTLTTLVGSLLDEAGYEHVSISDHAQISGAIERWKPRCVILDSDPGSAGHERSWADAAEIRRAHPELPVLMFTADPAAMAEARAGKTPRSRAAGYAGVLDKPFLVVEFLATLKHAVDAPQSAAMRDGKGIGAEAISVFPDLGGPASTDWSSADTFAMAAHELRSPLTAIDGQAQLAQRHLKTDPARTAESLARIREQTRRLDRMLDDLLDHSRASAGIFTLEVVTFDLAIVIASTIGLRSEEEAARITFDEDGPVRVRADPDRIEQIMANLLDNAVKFSAAGSAIEVSLIARGADAEVRVTDRGVGVPEAEQDRLFTTLFRTSRTADVAGTGLGLYISRRIAEQHRGRLRLESSSEKGSTFVLTLPLATPMPQS